jgi:inosose dehydratase
MDVMLGVTSCVWDDISSPLETCFAEAAAAGYKGIEWGSFFPDSSATLLPLLHQHQLRLVSGYYASQLLTRNIFEELDCFQQHLALLKACTCNAVVFCDMSHATHQAPLSQRPTLTEHAWQTLLPRIQTMAHVAVQQGFKMAYYPHLGTAIQNAQDIHRLLAHTDDSVGLLLDTGHLAFAGSDPVRIAQRYGHRILHMHAQDIHPQRAQEALAQNMSFAQAIHEGVFINPGEGCVDYRSIFHGLRALRYKGWCVVNAHSHVLRTGYQYLSSVLKSVLGHR